ncbi:MAG: cyclic nucleotide-binding domain-containing protein [Eubacteriales bacterium]|nr:cyclic nucleotide-binding domain-containing protein [Eubacteriales bacterium]
MKQIPDKERLDSYVKRYRIDEIFDTEGLPFRLCQYEKGEILNYSRDSASFLLFMVEGSVQIYSLREDGRRYPLCLVEEFTLLGDMEFCGETTLPFLVEVVKKVVCVELPLYEYRKTLLEDNAFLRFLLGSVSHKLALFSQTEAGFAGIEEKLLSYLEYECPAEGFQGVEKVAVKLRCSRRQLQRVLKDLTEKGTIVKVGKGRYRLASSGKK